MSFHTVIKTKTLTESQSKQIDCAWNEEYPLKLNNRFGLLINEAKSHMHYIIENEKQEVIAGC